MTSNIIHWAVCVAPSLVPVLVACLVRGLP